MDDDQACFTELWMTTKRVLQNSAPMVLAGQLNILPSLLHPSIHPSLYPSSPDAPDLGDPLVMHATAGAAKLAKRC